jgi:glycerol-3-phosphate dehydrogenase
VDQSTAPLDVFIIGGGINGAGIARDFAGRGLTVGLAEMNDFASATSSSSTKLFHGGLRYLEFFEFNLVKKALIEREVLLEAMPHISWPMRFVLPYHADMRFEGGTPTSKLLSAVMPWMKGRRPAWLIRLGLFLYDHLGGRKILPGTRSVDLRFDPVGAPLKDKFARAFEYSDCWVEDSRLVVLNIRDAQERGAQIFPRTKVVQADRSAEMWKVHLEDTNTGEQRTISARTLVNAGGPWVDQVIGQALGINSSEGIRLVRGSHIVTRKLYDHDKCYFFQGEDGRIIFAIPYETDFTLIGTTDQEHHEDPSTAHCTPEERDYLLGFASNYFERALTPEDVVWSYSGVRPLYDDGAKSATAATRDYVLSLNSDAAPVLNVFGGKITTYRVLAEQCFEKMSASFSNAGKDWSARVPLPGGDFAVSAFDARVAALKAAYPFLTHRWAKRLVRAYGTEAALILNGAASEQDLGEDFGATLTEAEVTYLMDREYAQRAEDVLWRRSKLGLHFDATQTARLDAWMTARRATEHT